MSNGIDTFRYRDAAQTEVILDPGGVVFPVAEAGRYGCVLAEVLPYDAGFVTAWEQEREEREAAQTAAAAARAMIPALAASAALPDAAVVDVARAAPGYFPLWKAGTAYPAGARLRYGDHLVLVAQAVTAQAHQPPLSTGMSAIYRAFSLHAGTEADPIPFVTDMNASAGEYYTHDGWLWLCTGDLHPAHAGREPGAEGVHQWQLAGARG